MVDKGWRAFSAKDESAELTGAAVVMWISGLDSGDIAESWDATGFKYTRADLADIAADANRLERHDTETFRLLTAWQNYISMSEAECLEVSAQDFVIAASNSIFNQMEGRS